MHSIDTTTGLGNIGWPELAADCDPKIAEAINTLVGLLRVNDALMQVSRTIGARRRRAREKGSDQDWWPELNRELSREHVVPLQEDVLRLAMRDRYASFVVTNALQRIRAFLEQTEPSQPTPGRSSDMQLVEDCLQPIFERLPAVAASSISDGSPGDPNGGEAVLRKLQRLTLRQWLEIDGGADLEHLLQSLVLAEYYTADCADRKKLFEHSEKDCRAKPIYWNESGLDALLVAVGLVRQRIEEKQRRKRKNDSTMRVYFCELCDELTQWMLNERDPLVAGTGSRRYCERHASTDRHLYQSDSPKRREFEWTYAMVLDEAWRDAGYKERFLRPADPHRAEAIEHTSACHFCRGRAYESACFDPSKPYFRSLLAYHANARKVAYALAHSHHDGRAFLLDEATQRGDDLREAAKGYRLHTNKAAGQHCGLSMARLLHQGMKGSDVADQLGISPSAVSQRKASLRGAFDFSAERHMELIWWPFDDIYGPNVMKFPSRPLGWEWRHSDDEYRHLARAPSRRKRVINDVMSIHRVG